MDLLTWICSLIHPAPKPIPEILPLPMQTPIGVLPWGPA